VHLLFTFGHLTLAALELCILPVDEIGALVKSFLTMVKAFLLIGQHALLFSNLIFDLALETIGIFLGIDLGVAPIEIRLTFGVFDQTLGLRLGAVVA
jgi:hypothetical protein